MLGGRRRLQSNRMCSAFWVAAPRAHEADVLSPHLCISAPIARRARARVPGSCRPRSVVLGRVQRSGAAKRERESLGIIAFKLMAANDCQMLEQL